MGIIRPKTDNDYPFEVLPLCVEPYNLFCEFQSSFFVYGFSGICGVNLSAIIDAVKIRCKKKERDFFMGGINAIANGFLLAISDEHRESNDKDPLTSKEREEIKNRRAWRC